MSLPTMPRSAAPYWTYVGISAGLRKMKRRSRSVSASSSLRVSASRLRIPVAESSWSAGSSNRPLGSASVSGGGMLAQPLDVGAENVELLLESLVAAVQVVDAGDLGGAARREAGQHERGRGAEIRRHDGRALVGRHAAHHRDGPVRLDERPHTAELGRVHEAVLEYGLGDLAEPFREPEQRHHLRLHVRRESWERARDHVRGPRAPGRHASDALAVDRDGRAALLE